MPLIIRALPLSLDLGFGIWDIFFHDFSSKFPCLKDLALHDCGGFESMQISCPSLESISIVGVILRWTDLDVPNICRFAFSGSKFPYLCFNAPPNSREWEPDMSIAYKSRYSWFTGLKIWARPKLLSHSNSQGAMMLKELHSPKFTPTLGREFDDICGRTIFGTITWFILELSS